MIKTVGLVGAGAVGSSLIYEMYKRDPENVYLVATGDRAERIRAGISVNNEIFSPKVYSNPSDDVQLDLLIVAVKTYGLEAVLEDIRPLVDESTIILPIQNGIKATSIIEKAFPNNRVFYGVVLRTDAHRISRRVYFRTLGELQFGYAFNDPVKPEVQESCDRLCELGINAKIYPDMRKMKWRKWLLNTGGSQAAVEVLAECGFFGQISEIEALIRMLMDEILAVGKAEGVNIDEKDRDEMIDTLINFPPDKKMSMLQDYEAGRPIEVDDYAGTVIELGRKHGIPTPANEILYLTITARQKLSELRKG